MLLNNDYVKRSDVMYAACLDCYCCATIDEFEDTACLNKKKFMSIPAADVELVRHGYNVKRDYPTLFECSLCGWECFDTVPGDTDTYQYCPNCGAKMDAEPPKEEKN